MSTLLEIAKQANEVQNQAMSDLTDNMLRQIEPVLEKYRAELFSRRRFEPAVFERELRDSWDEGYQGLKPLIEQMAGHGRYQEVAAYYMEHSNAPGVVSEFQPVLAKLYGIHYYHVPEREKYRAAFWAGAFGD